MIIFTQKTQYAIVVTVNSLDSSKRDYTPKYKMSKFDSWHSFANPQKHVTCVRYAGQEAAENHIYRASKNVIGREDVQIEMIDQTA